MSIEVTAKIIQFILAPAVMISSCAILLGGMQTHYGSISDRLRTLAHERLELLRKPDGSLHSLAEMIDAFSSERLHQIDVQMPILLRRLLLVRNAILATYLAILCFIASMFAIAIAALTSSSLAASMALYLFLGSTAVLLFGIAQIARNIRLSQAAVSYEANRVLALGREPTPQAGDARPGGRVVSSSNQFVE